MESVVRMLLSLVVVISAAVVFIRIGLPWFRRRSPGQSSRLALEYKLPIDTRKSLAIVTVDQRRLLIGVSDQTVNLILELLPGSLSQSGETTGERCSDPDEMAN